MAPVNPQMHVQYQELQDRVDSVKRLLEGEDWFGQKRTCVWASFQAFNLSAISADFRGFLDEFDISVWVFPDRVEVRGLIPTQVVRRIPTSESKGRGIRLRRIKEGGFAPLLLLYFPLAGTARGI